MQSGAIGARLKASRLKPLPQKHSARSVDIVVLVGADLSAKPCVLQGAMAAGISFCKSGFSRDCFGFTAIRPGLHPGYAIAPADTSRSKALSRTSPLPQKHSARCADIVILVGADSSAKPCVLQGAMAAGNSVCRSGWAAFRFSRDCFGFTAVRPGLHPGYAIAPANTSRSKALSRTSPLHRSTALAALTQLYLWERTRPRSLASCRTQ